jgi:hypothetical protein
VRSKLIYAAILVGATFYIFNFAVPETTALGERLKLAEVRMGLARGANVVITLALGLGVINLVWVHGANIIRRKKEWPFSVVAFGMFAIVFTMLLYQYRNDAHATTLEVTVRPTLQKYQAILQLPDAAERDRALAALAPAELDLLNQYYEDQATYRFSPRNFYATAVGDPLVSTVMALLGFYVTYAAYRAFRIRSLEGTVMMISAVIVVLGSDPLGGWVSAGTNALLGGTHAVDLPTWADFDNRVINSGMQRGLGIGISVAVIAASLRIVLGLEKGLLEVRRAQD